MPLARPAFRFARPFRLRFAACPSCRAATLLAPGSADSFRDRLRLAARPGLRALRLFRQHGHSALLRLHSRTTLHSGRSTGTACSSVRLSTPLAPNRFQRGETARDATPTRCRALDPHAPTRRQHDPPSAVTLAPVGEHQLLVRSALSPPKVNRAPQRTELRYVRPAPVAPASTGVATALRWRLRRPASCPSSRPCCPSHRLLCCHRTIRRYVKRALFRALSPSIPSARGIHSASLRRITYRGIVRWQQGSRPNEFPHEAREIIPAAAAPLRAKDTPEALSRRRIRPLAPARFRPWSHAAARLATRRVVSRWLSRRQAPPGALSLRSFAGELPPAAQAARWPRASSPLRCAAARRACGPLGRATDPRFLPLRGPNATRDPTSLNRRSGSEPKRAPARFYPSPCSPSRVFPVPALSPSKRPR